MVFCEIIRVVELNWMSLTRGPLGIMAIPKPKILGFLFDSPQRLYFFVLVMVVLSTLVVHNLMNSRIGYAILSIRDDELAAESMGIPVFRFKMVIFVISSMMVGLAGAFYAAYTSYIDPSSFAASQSNNMLVMVIFGGLGNVVGSFIGAIVLTVLAGPGPVPAADLRRAAGGADDGQAAGTARRHQLQVHPPADGEEGFDHGGAQP